MINTKMIRNKMISIGNTKKITKTMEMIAITKIKKIKTKLLISQPYLNSIKEIIFHFLHGNLQYNTFLKKKKNINKIGIIVLSSNQGLCGGLNNNIFKMVDLMIVKNFDNNIKCSLYILGKKGSLFFKDYNKCNIYKTIPIQENIQYSDLKPLVNMLLLHYNNNIFDQLFIASNKFYNTVIQKPKIFQILPINPKDFLGKSYTIYKNWTYLYESNQKETIDIILNKYITFQLLQLILENILSEYSARMVAMKTATDNSQKIITDLQILYNKIRQFSITQELIEIVSGANVIL